MATVYYNKKPGKRTLTDEEYEAVKKARRKNRDKRIDKLLAADDQTENALPLAA